jgi:hypothetical protein
LEKKDWVRACNLGWGILGKQSVNGDHVRVKTGSIEKMVELQIFKTLESALPKLKI